MKIKLSIFISALSFASIGRWPRGIFPLIRNWASGTWRIVIITVLPHGQYGNRLSEQPIPDPEQSGCAQRLIGSIFHHGDGCTGKSGQLLWYARRSFQQAIGGYNLPPSGHGNEASKHWGSSIGLVPFSTQNYEYDVPYYLQGSSSELANHHYQGHGGVNKAYWPTLMSSSIIFRSAWMQATFSDS